MYFKLVEEIDKTLPEDKYYEQKALEEFGKTYYFYDAGYILKDGSMLNFSGEKDKHFGTRGEDHRAIAIIFDEDISGSEAMIKFMNYGNIRIMDESPGIDLIKEPTQKQYDTIERFISNCFKRREFYIDFSDTSGRTVYNKQYSGLLRSKNIIEDIKNYFRYGISENDKIDDSDDWGI